MFDPTYLSARLAMLLYVVALALLILTRGEVRRLRAARAVYSAGCVVLLIHIAIAFHRHHAWSHADAHAHVERRTAELTGFASGAGLWLNYLFALLWVADATYWWIAGADPYLRRPRWISAALHAFLLFMAINAAVVFALGPSRYVGAAVVVALAILVAAARL